MQKLLGLLILGLAFTIGFGTVGCSKKVEKGGQSEEEKKAASTKEAAEKAKKAAEEAAAKAKQADENAKKADEKAKAAEEAAAKAKAAAAEAKQKLFSLPALEAAAVEPGKKTDVTIKIDRGEKSEDPVEISFDKLPKGVKAEGGTIAKGKSDLTVPLDAGKDAEAGEATVTAKGGTQTYTQKLKITLKKK